MSDRTSWSLADAEAHLAELVGTVRRTRLSVVITVDGEPAAEIVPVSSETRTLSAAEVAASRALADAVARAPWRAESFDAVELLREGRR